MVCFTKTDIKNIYIVDKKVTILLKNGKKFIYDNIKNSKTEKIVKEWLLDYINNFNKGKSNGITMPGL